MKKEYTNGEVTIAWQPGICIHSEKCWRGLANLFQPKSKPWINAEGASSEEIEAQVNSARLVRWQRIETQMENRLRNHQEQQPLS